MKSGRPRRRREAHPELCLRAERKAHPGSVWQRPLTRASRWYIRVRLAETIVVRAAGGAQSEAGAREFLECFKAEFARTGRIPAGMRAKHRPSEAPAKSFDVPTTLFPNHVP